MQDHHESAVDRQIRLAAERGAFDNLPGAGKPLPGAGEPYDDLWWVRGFLRREGLSTELLLPPSIQLRKEIDRLPATLSALPDERAVRDAVAELNVRIVDFLRAPAGPRVRVGRVDVDDALRHWRAARPPEPGPPRPAAPCEPDVPRARRRWWHRLLGRA